MVMVFKPRPEYFLRILGFIFLALGDDDGCGLMLFD